MANDLTNAMTISASGMVAQTMRLRVIAQNIANQDTTGSSAGADPYRRKTITFKTAIVSATGTSGVKIKDMGVDRSEFPHHYDPSNPAADAQGYVKTPNVNSFIELLDMREAERSYNANLSIMQASRSMANRTIDILK